MLVQKGKERLQQGKLHSKTGVHRLRALPVPLQALPSREVRRGVQGASRTCRKRGASRPPPRMDGLFRSAALVRGGPLPLPRAPVPSRVHGKGRRDNYHIPEESPLAKRRIPPPSEEGGDFQGAPRPFLRCAHKACAHRPDWCRVHGGDSVRKGDG